MASVMRCQTVRLAVHDPAFGQPKHYPSFYLGVTIADRVSGRHSDRNR